MKFYVLENTETGATVTCELTIQRCRDEAETQGIIDYRIDLVEVEVTPEAIRRLLGQIGGFAKDTRTVREVRGGQREPAPRKAGRLVLV